MARGKACVLMSGGVESAALAVRLLEEGRRVLPLYVAGGFRWEKAERAHLERFLRGLAGPALAPLAVLRLEQRDLQPRGHWSVSGWAPGARSADERVELMGRNLLLLSKAAAHAAQEGASALAIGTLASNPFRDARPGFFRALERAFAEGLGAAIRVEAPLRKLTKGALLRRYPGLPWERTFSCILPRRGRHCGRCNKCGERRLAFRRAGLADPTRYLA